MQLCGAILPPSPNAGALMRIIFSRKGFDSQYGRVPSPIFPGGSFASVPIPSRFGRPLGDVGGRSERLSDVMCHLTRGAVNELTSVHVDPDLSRNALARRPAWRPAFGQVGAAQAHLANQGVQRGDVFLFFGWFRPVEQAGGAWRYVPGAQSFHSLFGWLQIDEVLAISGEESDSIRQHRWLDDHPHIKHAADFAAQANTIYVAADVVSFHGRSLGVTGGGVFWRWSPALQLSADGSTRSVWKLPGWMSPIDGRPALTYHSNQERWRRVGEDVLLQTVAKGQEFVLHTESYPEALPWLESLLVQNSGKT
jgi:hypothetical protein